MARRRIITDDFDGTESALPVFFTIEGERYVIDLSAKHHEELLGLLAPYRQHGRRLGVLDPGAEGADGDGVEPTATDAPVQSVVFEQAPAAEDQDPASPPVDEAPSASVYGPRSGRRRPRERHIDWRRHEPQNGAELQRAARSFGVSAGLMTFGQPGAVPDYVLREFYVAHPTAWRKESAQAPEPTAVPSLVLSAERSVMASDEVLAWALKFAHPVRDGRVRQSTMDAFADYQQRHHPDREPVTASVQLQTTDIVDKATGELSTEQPVTVPSREEILAEFSAMDLDEVTEALSHAPVTEIFLAWEGEYSSIGSDPVPEVQPPADPTPSSVLASGKERNHKRLYPQGLREWARGQGYRVGNGTVRQEVLDAYAKAHPAI